MRPAQLAGSKAGEDRLRCGGAVLMYIGKIYWILQTAKVNRVGSAQANSIRLQLPLCVRESYVGILLAHYAAVPLCIYVVVYDVRGR